MKKGLVIGKFYPFHAGHMYLLDTATANCDELTVWVALAFGEEPMAYTRAEWIRNLYPKATVVVYPNLPWISDDDSRGWANYTLQMGVHPDVVFTSEDYGIPYAKYLGAEHVMVDRHRLCVPISGTQVRANPLINWKSLAPPVRAYYAKRVVATGAESTGTTTIAQTLANHYLTNWVPEYGREYSALHTENTLWDTNEFVHIAMEQTRRENEAARHANRVLICDTDAFATCLWHERYLGLWSKKVERIAAQKTQPDLYLLTGDEIPFVQDGTRDGEHIRHAMHRRFEERLMEQPVPFLTLRGSREERLAKATFTIDQLLVKR